jgi:hypothetical protein
VGLGDAEVLALARDSGRARIADALEALLRAHPGDDSLRDTEAWI